MTTRYIGATDNTNYHRLAVIQYNEDKVGEEKKAEKIADKLEEMGYIFLYHEQEEIAFLIEDRDEYTRYFVKDFRKIKKEV